MSDVAVLELDARPSGQLLIRAAQVTNVSWPDHTIELVVIPYETDALVSWEGRPVTEVIDRHAFSGVQRRERGRIRAFRGHGGEVVGKVMKLWPNRPEGLVAEVDVCVDPEFPLGRATMAQARDGLLDASAGFIPMADGIRWETRSRYRVTKAWLDHVALVADPAYSDARVLAVRERDDVAPGRPATPNLDRVRQMLAADRLAAVASRLALDR